MRHIFNLIFSAQDQEQPGYRVYPPPTADIQMMASYEDGMIYSSLHSSVSEILLQRRVMKPLILGFERHLHRIDVKSTGPCMELGVTSSSPKTLHDLLWLWRFGAEQVQDVGSFLCTRHHMLVYLEGFHFSSVPNLDAHSSGKGLPCTTRTIRTDSRIKYFGSDLRATSDNETSVLNGDK